MLKNIVKCVSVCAALFGSTLFANDAFVGEYVGTAEGNLISKSWKTVCARVSRHKDTYRVEIVPSLPQRTEVLADFKIDGAVGADKLVFGEKGMTKMFGEIVKDGEMTLNISRKDAMGSVNLKRLNRTSPTMGKKAPKGAVVLFDGSSTDAWLNKIDRAPCAWSILKDEKVLETRHGNAPKGKPNNIDISTKQKFGSFTLHLEFKLPNEYGKNQPKFSGNSGLYIGEMEIQILDSFGNDGVWNDCGAIYRYSPPRVNASLPPEVWQTYDLRYSAPKFDDSGKLVALPVVSLVHNGIVVQSDIVVTRGTSHDEHTFPSLIFKKGDELVPISLQDHAATIQFRNIWLVEKD